MVREFEHEFWNKKYGKGKYTPPLLSRLYVYCVYLLISGIKIQSKLNLLLVGMTHEEQIPHSTSLSKVHIRCCIKKNEKRIGVKLDV